jgi:phage terminase large subunit GpA-like protein
VPSKSVAEELQKLITVEDRRRMAEDVDKSLGLIPDRVNRMSVSEWAEAKRIIPQGLSPKPGPFRWSVTPYLREIADCLSEGSEVREVAVEKGARVGFTVGVIENDIGYRIDVSPGAMMFISASKGVTEASVELRVDRMIESAGLGDKVFSQSEKKHNKKTGDTKSKKEFAGGFLLAYGPNSAASLRNVGIQHLRCDEVDAWKHELGTSDRTKGKTANEGDPLALAFKRTGDFEDTRTVLYGGTPLDDADSKINPLFLSGDQRYYHVPCKDCGHMQPLRWRDPDGTFRMKFETDAAGHLIRESVHYECEKCGSHWKNTDKVIFLGLGEWRATAVPKYAGFRSYHLNSLYSPLGMASWEGICQEWVDAQGDLSKLRTFVNTVLGETWKEKGEAPIAEKVWARREGYPVGTLPASAKPLICTIGADVQKDRIEAEVVAWGRDKESWSVEYLALPGDTSDPNGEAWSALAKAIETTHAGFQVERAMIDSGYNSPVVYSFCDAYMAGVFPVKGYERLGGDKGTSRVYALNKVPGYNTPRADLDTTHLKLEVYNFLKRGTASGDAPSDAFPGFCHFPAGYSKAYFSGLMSEDRLPRKLRNGRTAMVWEQHGRNEPLDARAYALAGVYLIYGERWKEMQEGAKDGEEVPYSWSDFWDEVEAIKSEK